MPKLLDVEDLRVTFETMEGIVHAVNGVSFNLDEGRTLGVVGESGCGKTVTMLALLRLIASPPGKIQSGAVRYKGRDLLTLNKGEIEKIRGREIAMVFQDAMTSLNPVLTIGRQISETLTVHLGMSSSTAEHRTIELLELVGIPEAARRVRDYPHQFSGGMRQRAMIAMALACQPQVLIADEPTTALDVTIQAQIIDLVKDLRQQFGMAVIWITHDLGVVAELADRVAVMYAGYIVEESSVETIFESPAHPYTRALLKSLPRVDATTNERLAVIPGSPPDGLFLPQGCPFLPRCAFAIQRCATENPTLTDAGPAHRAACWVNPITGQER